MLRLLSSLCAFLVLLTNFAVGQDLKIDFNSTSQDGAANNEPDYQAYDAAHEITEDFITREYEAFGTFVSFTPNWPDSTDRLTMQMIDRTAGWDDFWVGEGVALLTDWIGVDTRPANGGNGDFTLENGGDFTRIEFLLEDVPPGTYDWVSYHHDTEMIHTDFFMEISTDGGSTFELVENQAGDDFHKMTNTSQNDPLRPNPDNPEGVPTYNGEDFEFPILLPSTVLTQINVGAQDLVIRFTPLSSTAVHTQILGINGFEMYRQDDPVPDLACDFNADDACTVEDIDLLLYDGLVNGGDQFDVNDDTEVNADDIPAWLASAGQENQSADYLLGDSNLDGTVDAMDLNNVGVNWQSVTATSWEQGDFDGDGDVDAGDLNSVGINWLSGVAAPANAVPEPSSLSCLLIAILGLASFRRRK